MIWDFVDFTEKGWQEVPVTDGLPERLSFTYHYANGDIIKFEHAFDARATPTGGMEIKISEQFYHYSQRFK